MQSLDCPPVSTVAQYVTSIMSPRPPSLLSNPCIFGIALEEYNRRTGESIRLPLTWTFISPTIIFVKFFVGTTDFTTSVIHHTSYCSGAVPLLDFRARRVDESGSRCMVRLTPFPAPLMRTSHSYPIQKPR